MKKILAITIPFLLISQAFALTAIVNNNTTTSFNPVTISGKPLGRKITPNEKGYPLNITDETPRVLFKGSDGNNSTVSYIDGVLQCTSQTYYPCTVKNNTITIENPYSNPIIPAN